MVLDANLLVALAIGGERSNLVEAQLMQWLEENAELYAPDLARYEIASAFTGAIAGGEFTVAALPEAFGALADLPIVFCACPEGERVVEIALQLKRRSAYDAAYLALAEFLQAELWTLDGKLFRNAMEYGFAVKLLDGELDS